MQLQVCHLLKSSFSIYPMLPELTKHFCQDSWKQKQCNLPVFLFKSKHLSEKSSASFCFHWSDRNYLILANCRNSRAAAVQGSSKALTKNNSSCCQVAGDKQNSVLPGTSKRNDTYLLPQVTCGREYLVLSVTSF